MAKGIDLSKVYVFENLPLALRQFVDEFETGRTAQAKAAIRGLFVIGFAVYDCATSLRKIAKILATVNEDNHSEDSNEVQS